MFEITLYLFGKPQWELSRRIASAPLRKKAAEISKRLERAALITQKLQRAGWNVFLDTYTLVFYNETITTLQELRAHLQRLGIRLKKTELYAWDEQQTNNPTLPSPSQ